MKSELTVPLSSLQNNLENQVTVIKKVSGKVLKIIESVSKKGNEYQNIVFADHSGVKVIINCTSFKLEPSLCYDLTLKVLKRNKYNIGLFLESAKLSLSSNIIEPQVDEELEWLNEHFISKELIIKNISPVVSNDNLYNMLDQSLNESHHDIKKDSLLKLEDQNGKIYFCRIWKDEPLQEEDLIEGTVVKFSHIEINKQKGSESIRNILRTPLSNIEILE